jgi:hypothetical protein
MINFYDILDTTVDPTNSTITASIGNAISAGSKKDNPTSTGNAFVAKSGTYADNAQVWGIIGVASRPAGPAHSNVTDCAQSISIGKSDSEVIIGQRDVRFQSLFSDIQPGETYIYAVGSDGTGTAVIKLKADGTININTNTAVKINAPSTQIGDNSAKALAYGASFDALVNILSTAAPGVGYGAAVIAAIAAHSSSLAPGTTSTTKVTGT